MRGGFRSQTNSALSMHTMRPSAEPASSQIVALAAFDGPEHFINADGVKGRYRRDVRSCRQSSYSAEPAVRPIAVAALAHWNCLRSALMALEPPQLG